MTCPSRMNSQKITLEFQLIVYYFRAPRWWRGAIDYISRTKSCNIYWTRHHKFVMSHELLTVKENVYELFTWELHTVWLYSRTGTWLLKLPVVKCQSGGTIRPKLETERFPMGRKDENAEEFRVFKTRRVVKAIRMRGAQRSIYSYINTVKFSSSFSGGTTLWTNWILEL